MFLPTSDSLIKSHMILVIYFSILFSIKWYDMHAISWNLTARHICSYNHRYDSNPPVLIFQCTWYKKYSTQADKSVLILKWRVYPYPSPLPIVNITFFHTPVETWLDSALDRGSRWLDLHEDIVRVQTHCHDGMTQNKISWRTSLSDASGTNH